MLSLKSSCTAFARCRFPVDRALGGPTLISRSYAVSRFPSRRPVGSGRRRESFPNKPDAQPQSTEEPVYTQKESRSSAQESPLWQESENFNVSDYSIEGLKRLLSQDVLVVERQIEMLNIFIGFEQTNKYSINGIDGTPLGFIAEEPGSFLSSVGRQVFATHRPFRALIMDTEGKPILWIRRPFAWINSRMYAQRPVESREPVTEDGVPILDTFAEVQQIWHPWRRRYDLFLRESPRRILSLVDEPQPEPEPSTFGQFAKVDAGFLAWNFSLRDARNTEVAFISREFRGFGREIFTDTGQYYISFGPRSEYQTLEDGSLVKVETSATRTLTVDERALVLSLAVNIDFDYFSRHSGHGGGLFSFTHID